MPVAELRMRACGTLSPALHFATLEGLDASSDGCNLNAIQLWASSPGTPSLARPPALAIAADRSVQVCFSVSAQDSVKGAHFHAISVMHTTRKHACSLLPVSQRQQLLCHAQLFSGTIPGNGWSKRTAAAGSSSPS